MASESSEGIVCKHSFEPGCPYFGVPFGLDAHLSNCILSLDVPAVPTLRDQFAMAAINGCCLMADQITDPVAFCESAYEIADAMMEARRPMPISDPLVISHRDTPQEVFDAAKKEFGWGQ